MRLQAIAAAAALSLAAGSAFAQTTSSNDAQGQATDPIFASELENKMYEDREVMRGFFVDDMFTEVRPAEENKTYFSELAGETQAQIKANCEQATDPGDYSPGTIALCSQIATY